MHAPELAEKLRAAIAARAFVLPDGAVLQRTCSIGVASWPFCPDAPRVVAWSRVVEVADAALYATKRSGRDAWVTVEAGDHVAGANAEAVIDAFRNDPAQSVASGEVTVSCTPRIAKMLLWE